MLSKYSLAPIAPSLVVSVATSAAMTAQVAPSGPPIVNRSELRNDVIAPPTAPVMNVAERPYGSQTDSGPEKISAA